MADDQQLNFANLTAEIASAFVINNQVPVGEVGRLVSSIHAALAELGAPEPVQPEPARPKPTVSRRKSLASPDHIISMIDGKPYKSLVRHLRTNGYTPDTYREAFGLPSDYPMVAPGYSEQRRALAKQLGLGRKPGKSAAPKRRKLKLNMPH